MMYYKVLLAFLIIGLSSCINEDDETFTPKPRSHFRISFPEKKYTTYDSLCPFKFEIPKYSKIVNNTSVGSEPCWLNLIYPQFKATLHLSYKQVDDNLDQYIKDSYSLTSKHQIKASGIEEKVIYNKHDNVYGMVYEIDGNAASALQFYITDSSENFIRGSLYFNAVPNIDSIAPVLSFVREDIYHLIETFKWK